MQRQIPAHIRIPHDQIRPQITPRRQARRHRTQLTWREAPSRRDQALEHLSNGPLALRGDPPAGLQPCPGSSSLRDADITWC